MYTVHMLLVVCLLLDQVYTKFADDDVWKRLLSTINSKGGFEPHCELKAVQECK